MLRELQLIIVASVVAIVQLVIMVLSLSRIVCFKKQINSNDCGIFELLQDLSMHALSKLSGKNYNVNCFVKLLEFAYNELASLFCFPQK